MTGTLFIVSAPSGAGKTSLVRALLDADAQVELSISHTTRAPRPGEVDGQHYHFVTRARFDALRDAGGFLECAEVHGNGYGTAQAPVDAALAAGRDALLEIDWQGAQQVRRLRPDAIGVFVLPPSLATLAARLAARGTDAPDVVARRLAAAKIEIGHVSEYDYVIVNDDFATAAHELQSIVLARRLRLDAQVARHRDILAGLT
ncbi:MAG: guanylate kinase [Burkholderiales bacterium]|jgi:guanylate kinase|nr:guanylate kinase [Burkholderiales bacterium]